MVLCRNGHPNPDGATYCGDCHVYIDEAAPPVPEPDPSQTEPGPTSAPAVEPPVVAVSQAHLRVSAGSHVSTEIRVVNPGEVQDEYIVEVQGAAAEWASVEPWRLSLPPGEAGTAELTFSPDSSLPHMSLAFEIRVTARQLPGEAVALLGSVEIEAPAVPQPQPAPQPQPPRSTPTYRRYRYRRVRGVGTSMFLIVIGAILLFADPSLEQTTVNLDRAGQVLLFVGAVGLVASLVAVFVGPARR
jgi:hypothetical protein